MPTIHVTIRTILLYSVENKHFSDVGSITIFNKVIVGVNFFVCACVRLYLDFVNACFWGFVCV